MIPARIVTLSNTCQCGTDSYTEGAIHLKYMSDTIVFESVNDKARFMQQNLQHVATMHGRTLTICAVTREVCNTGCKLQ